jgi:uncharacterized membrane protein (UPF0127 family)
VRWAALGVFASATGCDGRTPEVAPETATIPLPQSARSTSTVAAVNKKPRTQPPPKPERCIKPTTETPVRTYSGKIPAEGCPADPGAVALSRKKVEIPNTATGTLVVDAEVAASPTERERGLMYRTSMGENEGMLFVFEREKVLTFWMHNTCLPLDMIFIAADGTIVGIEENTPTLTDETFSPGCPARYVLEVNAGWSRKNGVSAGMKVKI